MKKYGRGWRSKTDYNVGKIIKEYLEENGEAFVSELYRAVKAKFKEEGVEYWGTRESFSNYINDLKKLNLIEFSRKGEAPENHLVPRRYYRLIERFKDSAAWDNPSIYIYPERIYGKRSYEAKKGEAEERGISVRELALKENKEIAEERMKLTT